MARSPRVVGRFVRGRIAGWLVCNLPLKSRTVKRLVEYCNREFPLPSVGSPSTGIHNLGPEQKLHKHTERPGDHDQLPSA